MRRLLAIRHAPTEWNLLRRIQGHADLPLAQEGRAQAAKQAVPADFVGAETLCSPLLRAVETARLMGLSPRLEPGLVEMNWGSWEGRTLKSLRSELGQAMASNEARGLDFRPEGGESPREVQLRLAAWLRSLCTGTEPLIAVTHKGVIRAMLAMAENWDMRVSPPVKLHWDRGHEFSIREDGNLRLTHPNLPL